MQAAVTGKYFLKFNSTVGLCTIWNSLSDYCKDCLALLGAHRESETNKTPYSC